MREKLFGGFEKRREERAIASGATIPEEKTVPSFSDLYHGDGKRLSYYFDSLPAASRRSAFAAWKRELDGNPTSASTELLMEHYEKYQLQLEKVEKVIGTIEEYAKGMMKHSPDFKRAIQFSGEERLLSVMSDGLRDLALRDPTAFAQIETQFQELMTYDERVEKPLEKKISAFCKKHGIAFDNRLRDAMDQTDPTARQQSIRELMRENFRWKQYFFDSFKGIFSMGTYGASDELAQEDVPRILAERNRLISEGGTYLHALLMNNKELREGLANARMGKATIFKEGSETHMTPHEAKAFMRELEEYSSKEATLKRVREFKHKHRRDNWAVDGDRLREEFYLEDEIRQAEYEKKKKMGTFAKAVLAAVKFLVVRGNAEIQSILS